MTRDKHPEHCKLGRCKASAVTDGLCLHHHTLASGNGRRAKPKDPEARFWSKVVQGSDADDCWGWLGYTESGYGRFEVQKMRSWAHHYSFFLANGRSHNGIVRHTCDNPECTNPRHLLEGSASDNSQDMVLRDRAAKGAQNGNSKLTEATVINIKQLLNQGRHYADIARDYAVAPITIYFIATGRTWKWLTSDSAQDVV